MVIQMKEIGVLDKALNVSTSFGREDITLWDPREKPFTLYGVHFEDGQYRRMPKAVAETVSDGVAELSAYTAGGRVAFRTNSKFVAISCRRPGMWKMSHMALAGSAGFDMYVRENGKFCYLNTFMPSYDSSGYDAIRYFPKGGEHEVLIHFPLYCPVSSLLIGLQDGASISAWDGYDRETPIVFYGSSITQGACASAPGSDYISRVSRRLGTNYRNLGFSGNAKGEIPMMEYMASLDMSAFVYDYDHNAPNVEHLAETHERGYHIIRAAHPDIPIVMLSRPTYDNPYFDGPARRDVIARTYENARKSGDRNVYFVDGAKEFATFFADGLTVDGTHPNDAGFSRMAEAVGSILERAFANS